MAKKSWLSLVLFSASLMSLASCGTDAKCRITFELDGGQFSDPNFSTGYLEGISGTPVEQEIPNPVKEGYYFVGWREKKADGSYRVINKRVSDDGKEYYYYPYVDDVFYAYFEPLATIHFDLGIGAERGASLVAPKAEATSYSDGKLEGYATKPIYSEDYLPTAVCEEGHLTFSHWYSEYPLVALEDENKQTHYSIDTTAAKGEYEFTDLFSGGMEFPQIEDDSFTLIASWVEDPTITLHYNLPGVENSSLQIKGVVYDSLVAEVKKNLGIDLAEDKERYYYKQNGLDKRFAGFYLDSEYKTLFSMDASVTTEDVDLYLKWEEAVTITMDYNGGTVGGLSSEVITGYYENDILGDDFYDNHKPTKADAIFNHFNARLEGESEDRSFAFGIDALPKKNITFTAVYEESPTLTLSFDYPTSYPEENKLSSVSYRVVPGEDLSYLLSQFSAYITDPDLEIGGYIYADDGSALLSTVMPDSDVEIALDLYYKSEVHSVTYLEDGGTTTLLDSASSYRFTYGFESAGVSEEDPLILAQKNEEIVEGGNTYLFDGFYTDETFATPVSFPFYHAPSKGAQTVTALYRKMSKAITLTFVNASDSSTLGTVHVLPGASLRSVEDKLAFLGSFTKLSVEVLGSMVEIKDYLPDSDQTIYVQY